MLKVRIFFIFFPLLLVFSPVNAAETTAARPHASLQSYTGIWDMPSARILPDWNVRFKYGKAEPFRYYGVALGLFDRLEFHGQFTETSSVIAFPGFGYGYHKDRNAGVRLVVKKEDELWPQIAIGAYDPIGTSHFPSRYVVMSKMAGNFDLTLGLGQGVLGGEAFDEIAKAGTGETFDTTFIFSSPSRQTKIFGGVEYQYTPKLTFSAEYSSLKYEGMFGGPEKARWPVNLGLKYQPVKHITLQGGYMRGSEWSLGLSADLPLDPESILPWKKEPPYISTEKKRWQANEADNRELAVLLASELKNDGFAGVEVSVNDKEIWIEFVNSRYLSHAKAMGRIARITDALVPPRITTFYLNLRYQGEVRQCFKANRRDLLAFMDSRMDRQSLLEFSDLSLYNNDQREEFFEKPESIGFYRARDDWFDYDVNLKVSTFLNNRAGFFKHKVFIQPRIFMYPWKNAAVMGELEFTLLNQYDEIIFSPLEPEPVRTDLVSYEKESHAHISVLAYDQHVNLPANMLGRFSAGLFESEYAGVGGEIFRFFYDGRFGAGLETEFVRKRDPEHNFKLSEKITKTYESHFVNLYGLLWPSQGLEAGLKIGKFLGEDVGFSLDLRRSFKYFTIGAWYTKTDTDHFLAAENRQASEKGVYIRIPLSLFTDHDRRGGLTYSFSSFTRDQGQTVRQPSLLYPMDPYQSVVNTESTLEDMRR